MIIAVNAGHIGAVETWENALSQWANDCERKLLGLHCGQMLDRQRHRQWAKSIPYTARFVGSGVWEIVR